MPTNSCPECGAVFHAGTTCQDHYHQMLYWENQNPANWEAHHLMVLSYHLQHPSLYAPDGLNHAMHLLAAFLEARLSTEAVRQSSRDVAASDQRAWKITARPGLVGSYPHPIHWTVRAGDVTAAGEPHYVESVRRWSQSILTAIRQSGNFPEA